MTPGHDLRQRADRPGRHATTDQAERLATPLAAVLDEPAWYTNFDWEVA